MTAEESRGPSRHSTPSPHPTPSSTGLFFFFLSSFRDKLLQPVLPSWCTAVWKVTARTQSVSTQGVWVPELKTQEHAEVWSGLCYYIQCLAAASKLLSSCLLQPVSPLSTSNVEAVEEGHTSFVQDQLLPFRFEAEQH